MIIHQLISVSELKSLCFQYHFRVRDHCKRCVYSRNRTALLTSEQLFVGRWRRCFPLPQDRKPTISATKHSIAETRFTSKYVGLTFSRVWWQNHVGQNVLLCFHRTISTALSVPTDSTYRTQSFNIFKMFIVITYSADSVGVCVRWREGGEGGCRSLHHSHFIQ